MNKLSIKVDEDWDFFLMMAVIGSMIGNFAIALIMMEHSIYPNFVTWCNGCNANPFDYQIIFIFGTAGILTLITSVKIRFSFGVAK